MPRAHWSPEWWAQLVGAPRVHPHKHSANYPPQEVEGLRQPGAFMFTDGARCGQIVGEGKALTPSSSTSALLAFFSRQERTTDPRLADAPPVRAPSSGSSAPLPRSRRAGEARWPAADRTPSREERLMKPI